MRHPMVEELEQQHPIYHDGFSWDGGVDKRGVFQLHHIHTEPDKRYQGRATQFMKTLTSLADKHKVPIELEVGGGEDAEPDYDLVNFYSNHGFSWGDHYMRREPSNVQLTEAINELEAKFKKHVDAAGDDIDHGSAWVSPSGKIFHLPYSDTGSKNRLNGYQFPEHGITSQNAAGIDLDTMMRDHGWVRYRSGYNGNGSNVQFIKRPNQSQVRAVKDLHGDKDNFFWDCDSSDFGYCLTSMAHYAAGHNHGRGINVSEAALSETPGPILDARRVLRYLHEVYNPWHWKMAKRHDDISNEKDYVAEHGHYGWLTPDGSFIHNSPYDGEGTHWATAKDVLFQSGIKLPKGSNHFDHALKGLGWVRVGKHGEPHFQFSKTPTHVQQEWLHNNMGNDVSWERYDGNGKSASGQTMSEFSHHVRSGGVEPATNMRAFLSEVHTNVLEWHKDSHKLTKNKDGTPKVFYHASNSPERFTEFRPSSSGTFGPGIYATDDPKEHEWWSNVHEHAQSFPLHGHMKQPFFIPSGRSDVKRLLIKAGIDRDSLGKYDRYDDDVLHPEHIESLKKLGYDGVVAYGNESGEGAIYNFFNPNQIKSVFNQNPTDHPAINMSEPGPILNADGKPQVFYHGTTKQFDTLKRNVPETRNDWTIFDRHLGAHVSYDPDVANSFTHSFGDTHTGAQVYPVHVHARKVYDLPQSYYNPHYGERKIGTDQEMILRDAANVVLNKDPELFADMMVANTGTKDRQHWMDVHHKVSNGGTHDAESRQYIEQWGHPYTPGNIAMNWLTSGLFQDSHESRMKLLNGYRDHLLGQGYDAINYTNTSPMETRGVEDKRSLIALDPEHMVKSKMKLGPDTNVSGLNLAEVHPESHFQHLTKPVYEDHFDNTWPEHDLHAQPDEFPHDTGRMPAWIANHAGKKWFVKHFEHDDKPVAYREELAPRIGHLLGMGHLFVPVKVIPNNSTPTPSNLAVTPMFEPHHQTLWQHQTSSSDYDGLDEDEANNKALKKIPYQDRLNTMLFDHIMGNGDRHEGNIGINEKTGKMFLFDHDNQSDSDYWVQHSLTLGNAIHKHLLQSAGAIPVTTEDLTPFIEHKGEIENLIRDNATKHGDKYALKQLTPGTKPFGFHERYRALEDAHQRALAGKPMTIKELSDSMSAQRVPNTLKLAEPNLFGGSLGSHWGNVRPHFEAKWKAWEPQADYDRHFDDWPDPKELTDNANNGRNAWSIGRGINNNVFVHDPNDIGRGWQVKTHNPSSSTQGSIAEEYSARVGHAIGLGANIPPTRMYGPDVSQSALVPGKTLGDYPTFDQEDNAKRSDPHVMSKMALFDYLISNGDRHDHNIMHHQRPGEPYDHTWLIDHSHVGNAALSQSLFAYRSWKHHLSNDDPMSFPNEHRPLSDYINDDQLDKVGALSDMTSQFNHRQSHHFPNLADQRVDFLREHLKRGSTLGMFLNDVMRHTFTYDKHRTDLFAGKPTDSPKFFA